MHIAQAKTFISQVVTKEVHQPIMLVGAMGVGKSQIVAQVAEELGIDCVDLRLATQDPGDLIGLPRVTTLKDGTLETTYARPQWFPKPGTKGILFFDELNRAPVDVRNAIFQILTEGHLHTHRLPEGWYIVSAVNPDNGLYQVEQLDQAMMRRFCVIAVSANAEDWMSWAHSKDTKGNTHVDDVVTSFIGAHSNLLCNSEDIKIDTKPTPAGYHNLSKLLRAKAIPQEIEIDVFTGLIGSIAAIALRKYLDSKYTRPASGDEVINNYDKVRAKVKAQPNDENFVTVKDLIAVLENIAKPTKAQIDNLRSFLKDLPNESQALCIKKLPKHWFSTIVGCEELTQVVTSAVKSANK